MKRLLLVVRPLRFLLAAALVAALPAACAQRGPARPAAAPPAAGRPSDAAAIPATGPTAEAVAAIRDEGLNRSQVAETLDYLCNVIGPRLTGSPNLRRANEWTRETLAAWGLADARLEAWGPFGHGWSVRQFSMRVTEPTPFVLVGYPKAWSPGFAEPLAAGVVHLDAKNEADLARFKGKLKGQIVLIGPPRAVEPLFQPLATRIDDERLARLAAARAGEPANRSAGGPTSGPATARRSRPRPATAAAGGELLVDRAGGPATSPATGPATGPASPATSPAATLAAQRLAGRLFAFAAKEGAALVATPSPKGDGGTYFVTAAALPNDPPPGTRNAPATRPRPWSPDAPATPPQVTLGIEDYNRLVRLLRQGAAVKAEVDLRVEFHADDVMAHNTLAEIPGSDLRDEVVMVGAHLDSWHAGAGATDNAVGSAAAMEAVRIIRALDLKPRRTIRVALWTGEEQGLFGSTAYVKRHFGHVPEPAGTGPATGPSSRSATGPATAPATGPAVRLSDGTEPDGGADNPATRPATGPVTGLVKGPDYDRLSAYFNLDNGTGRVRGIYAQGNEAAVPLFRRWLRPLADLGAATVTLSATGATDHIPFDRVGLPGFGFIQDPIEYSTRTHHSNQDVFDRVQLEDLKQASTVMAVVLWEAANADDRFPRKPAAAAAAATAAATMATTRPADGRR